ncbi:tetratricopeptide repeat protein [Actinoallomurus sp. NPDC052308]|uniref:tetratricopeptide repeat protein n=1 Tax=Actinoallomurus sp. NPDC052308 TaxID=3155530 RepID=UPI0034212F83
MSGLCLTVSVDDRHRWGIPERILLRSVLNQAVEIACRRSGFAGRAGHRLHTVDGICQVLPGDPDAGWVASVPALLREFTAAIANAGRQVTADPPVRPRLVLSSAPVLPPGLAGRAVAEGLRLATSERVGAVLHALPDTDPAVVLSNGCYRETVERNMSPLRAEEFLRIDMGPGFPSTAWLHAPNAPRRSAAEQAAGRAVSPADGLLVRARRQVEAGDPGRAVPALEKALRLPEGLDGGHSESALLLLGDCRLHLGDLEAAAQTWLFLLLRHPLNLTAWHRLGRVAARQGRTRLAMAYLGEGLRLLQADPRLSPAPDRAACGLLLDLARLEEALGNPAAADERLNQAADADPSNPSPLVSLAYQAARYGDTDAARRLFDTAIARVPPTARKEFLKQQSANITEEADGSAIMELLLENDLDPAVDHSMPGTGHPSSALSGEPSYGTRTVAESVLPRRPDEADPG